MLWAIEQGMCGDGITVVPEVPRQLADSLARGAYHTAIVPVFEYFRNPDLYCYLPGPVIASRGEVYSVVLVSAEPWESLKRIYLDASSLTSVHLFKVLAAEKGLLLEYLDTTEHAVPSPLPPETGWVVIGDPAIAQQGRHPYTLDLGLAWQELTALPFVFAAWLAPRGVQKPGLTELLQASLKAGMQNLEQVAVESAARFDVTPEFALLYFTTHIHYYLGDKELAGWAEFGRLCHKHGLISNLPELRPYLVHNQI
jgi:chorismate dehydratase